MNFATQGANRVPRILYFIDGMVPTDDQKDDIARFGPNASFRNAQLVSDVAMSALEECDAVAGDPIPARYAATFPNVSGLDFGDRLPRMSDLDRLHGPIHGVDNEAARAAKPPAINQDQIVSQGAPRPAGAITMVNGGFVAPAPGNPDNLPTFGSERAENGPEGANREGAQGNRANPQGLPDKGVALTPPELRGNVDPAVPMAEGGGQGGFSAPKPAEPEGDKPKAAAKAKGATGSTGN